jgi:hypothetical protein
LAGAALRSTKRHFLAPRPAPRRELHFLAELAGQPIYPVKLQLDGVHAPSGRVELGVGIAEFTVLVGHGAGQLALSRFGRGQRLFDRIEAGPHLAVLAPEAPDASRSHDQDDRENAHVGTGDEIAP